MSDDNLSKQLKNIINQMTPKQKEKLERIMQDEEQIKKVITGADLKKAQNFAKKMNINIDSKDIDALMNNLNKNNNQ